MRLVDAEDHAVARPGRRQAGVGWQLSGMPSNWESRPSAVAHGGRVDGCTNCVRPFAVGGPSVSRVDRPTIVGSCLVRSLPLRDRSLVR